VDGAGPVSLDTTELLLNKTWRPQLSVIGANGFPPAENAGNVLRAETVLKLSFRLPPPTNPHKAYQAIKQVLEKDPPYGAKVTFEGGDPAAGWESPPIATWLEKSLLVNSQLFFSKPALYQGEGGSIPFMGLLGEQYPKAQFVITGVLGPQSNAHGPNEFIDLPYTKKVTCCIGHILEDFSKEKACSNN